MTNPLYANIPAELKALRQWVSVDMSINPDTGHPSKRPMDANTGYPADVMNPATWATFEKASSLNAPIGFVFSTSDPYAIIDLDNKPHKPATPAQLTLHNQILTGIESYIERSISGSGYHVVIRGSVPHGINYGNVELYSSGRYMIFTGDVVKAMPIDDYDEAINNMFNQMSELREKVKRVSTTELVQVESHLEDGDLFTIGSEAVNGDKFNQLCAGNWQQYGFPSQSEADLALMSMFAFYSKDNEQCKRVFRMTALGKREKYQTNDNHLNRMLQIARAKEPQPVDMQAVNAKVEEVMATMMTQPATPVTLPPPPPAVPVLNVPPPPALDILHPPGLLQLMADYMYQTAPYQVREYAVCASIAMLAGICARAYNISRTGLNQYIIVLGGPGTGKESMASGIGRLTKAINDGISDPRPVDIGKFASVQGLQKALINQPCGLSILGEVGNEFKIMLSPKCDPNRLEIKNAYLNLYNKSGEGESFSPVTYSKSENNMQAVISPNLSLLGESVQHGFYENINEKSAQDGFLSRLMVVEYNGLRLDLNEDTNIAPSDQLVRWLASIRDHANDLQARNTVCHIETDPPAKIRLREYAKYTTARINQATQSGSLGVAELLVRSHVKVLKLAGLGAVAINNYTPVVTLPLVEWAIAFVNKADSVMTTRFESGEIGEVNDTQCEPIIRKAILAYFKMSPKNRIDNKTPVCLAELNVISYSYLRQYCKQREPFKSHKLGYAKSIEMTIADMVKAGILVQIPASQLPKAANGAAMIAYSIGDQF